MSKQGKVWGNTELVFINSNVEIHRLDIFDGGYCSKHKHEHKFNMFFVESGRIEILVWQNAYNLIDTTVVSCGEKTTVSPNHYHKFIALEDSIVYEIYWSELNGSDIIRDDIGGILG